MGLESFLPVLIMIALAMLLLVLVAVSIAARRNRQRIPKITVRKIKIPDHLRDD